MAIHCKLSTILGEKRLKQMDVVRSTGLAKATVGRLYHDESDKIDLNVLDKLCKYLSCKPGDLLIYEEEKQGRSVSN